MKLKAAKFVIYVVADSDEAIQKVDDMLSTVTFKLPNIPGFRGQEWNQPKIIEIEARNTTSYPMSWLERTIGHMVRLLRHA